MFDYWVVMEYRTGKIIAHCGDENDARMLCGLRSTERTYKKQKFLIDQVIDITSTTDKQLPGQIGLPSGQDKIVEHKIYQLKEDDHVLIDLT